VWTAVDVEGKKKPDEVLGRVSTKSGSGERLPFSLGNAAPWPAGDYKVDLYLNDAKKPTKTLEFKVL
jgi:outer membrane usher protein FimD/PapC